jgi:co-chaperonin GroES (HSP10)
MKTLDLFIVELESQTNDTIKTESGLELYIDTKFNQFEHRVTEGPIVASPSKYDTGAKAGDTLYFHHLVVMNEGQVLTGNDNHYLVRYDDEHTINNQAIAYKCKDTGEVYPLAGWVLLTSVEEESDVKSDSIELVELEERLPRKGRVAFDTPWGEYLGVKKDDIVGFKENRDYRITIDGVEYYRVRAIDLLYVEEEVHND